MGNEKYLGYFGIFILFFIVSFGRGGIRVVFYFEFFVEYWVGFYYCLGVFYLDFSCGRCLLGLSRVFRSS